VIGIRAWHIRAGKESSMSRLPTSSVFVVLLGLLLSERPVAADTLVWDYSTFVFPTFVSANPGGPPSPASPTNPFPWLSSGGIAFTGNLGLAFGSQSIVFANWFSWGVLPTVGSSTFDHQPLSLVIGIHDWASNESKLATFTAYLDGTISSNGANLVLTSPTPSQTLHLGSASYRIDLGSITLSGPPGGHGPVGASAPVHPWPNGSILARVEVNQGPEPSTLVLFGVGGSLAAFLYHRRTLGRSSRKRAQP
jgi:hypothetical protein